MKKELLDKEVLAMYDVRGIQSYIFKSNKAKEIIGASVLVADVITKGINSYIENKKLDKDCYKTIWQEDQETEFLNNKDIQMQVMFVGGGNAYVLFRTGDICQDVNKYLSRYIMETTYSLNLAIAVIEKTDSYSKDYESINEEMRRIKAYMPSTQPLGALPFMETDSIIGFPLSKEVDGKKYSTESFLKRSVFHDADCGEQVFDHMVTEKGDNSILALCHIDGNSMGSQIKMQMENCEDYLTAIRTMRSISLEIAQTFRKTFDDMTQYMDKLSPMVKGNLENKLYREIIVAGDDITFVCNAKLAIPAVKFFLKHIGDEKISYSACGGIAFFNSHFPFSDAYQVAESCCENAKKCAKEKSHRGKEDKIGNYFDFQMCSNISASQLEAYRQKHYMLNGQLFIGRPYYVSVENDEYKLNDKNRQKDVSQLEHWQKIIYALPRNKAKLLRDSVTMGESKRVETITFLNSRGYKEFEMVEEFNNQDESKEQVWSLWYDATELMDLYIDEGNLDDGKKQEVRN
ncbi:MAG: hypothetical protein MR943_06810 [Lachnobacterium sp.]|nr:hypothetical protein [Lachnobacterium sp.]